MVLYILIIYVWLKVQLGLHGFMYSLFLCIFAVHVLGAICTHPQEHQLRSTALGVCNVWKAEVMHSIKRCGVIYYIYIYIFFFWHEFVGMCVLINRCSGCFA
jgi:hypothetical protein